MKRKLKLNSLFVKILCVVVVGVICASISVGYITINIYRNIFIDNYKDSQKKIFDQINNEIYEFHSEIVKNINAINFIGLLDLILVKTIYRQRIYL